MPPVLLPSGTGDLGRLRGAKCKVRAQSFPSERRERPGKVCEPVGPERSVGRGLARSGPPATIGGPEGKKGAGSGPQVSVSKFVANGGPLTRASVFVSPVWRMSPSHFRGESSIRPGNSWISNVIYELGVVSRLGLARRGRRAHGRPALYTNTSMRPNRRTVALTADAGRLVMDNRDARAVRALTPYLAATAPTSQPMKYPQRSPDSPIRESTARPAPSGGPEFALRSTARWGPNWSPAQ